MIPFRFFPRSPAGLTAALLATLASAPAALLINEADCDQTGNDAAEFIEIYNEGGGNTSLDNLALVFYSGFDDTVYLAIDLTGETTNAYGYYVVGNPGVPNVGKTFPANTFQNGQDAVALYALQPGQTAATRFPNGSALTTEDVVDALVYDTDDVDDPGLLALLLEGEPQVNENGAMSGTTVSMSRVPNGGEARRTTIYALQTPSPGASNVPTESLNLQFAVATISESAGAGATTATISRSGPTTSALMVTLVNGDASEISIPPSVEIPVGSSNAVFSVDAVNDAWADGPRTISVTAVALSFEYPTASIQVTDDGDPAGLVLNEFHATGLGDANLDGANQNNRGLDEFIELVNVTAAAIDLGGFTVLDGAGLANPEQTRHTFPAGTVVNPGCALVLFGGGEITDGIKADFGNAWVEKCNGNAPFGLGLNDRGDIISVRNTTGAEIAGAVFGALPEADDSNSQNLETDLLVTAPVVAHSTIAAANGALFSPGTRVDGTSYCAVEGALGMALNPIAIIEDAGAGATTLTITRRVPFTGNLTVLLSSSDVTEAAFAQTIAVIPDGQPSVNVMINAVNDNSADGPQTAVISATAAGYLTGTINLEVQDDGLDTPLTTLFINEVDSDQPAADVSEFIELYDGGLGNRSLDGFIIVLFNGSIDASYLTIDLSGRATNNQGFFVIGNVGVPGVDFIIPDNTLQNGADAVALYKDTPASFPNDTPPTATNLIDAIVYGTVDPDDTGLLDILTPGKPQANEGDTNNTNALARRPDATTGLDPAAFVTQSPSPGSTNVLAPGGYDAWAAGFSGLGGRTDDPDSDGIINALEYALGGNPLVPNTSILPQVTLSPSGKLRITVAKGAPAGADPQLTYTAQSSTTLAAGSWGTNDVTIVTESATTLVAEYSGPASRAALRLMITLAP